MAQELKSFEVTGKALFGRFYTKKVYDKSEADKVISHNKYKRCFKMATWCISMMIFNSKYGTDKKWHLYKKRHKRWLELAEKFKPNSTAQQGKG